MANQAYPTLVTQENHYDPWGVAIEQDVVADKTKLPNFELRDRFSYNGKELQGNLNYLDYGARMYDPSIGRENGVDQLSELDFETSPYAYAGNDPVRFVDLFGLKKGDSNDPYELEGVTVKGNRLPQYNDFWVNVSLAYKRNELLYGHASPYREHFQSGGRDAAVVVVGVPLAMAGIGTLASAGSVQLLTGAQRIAALRKYSLARTFARKYIVSGLNPTLMKSKLALSLTSQLMSADLAKKSFLESIDFADIAIDQLMHPFAGALTSSIVNLKMDGPSFETDWNQILIGTVVGTISGKIEGRIEAGIESLNGSKNFSNGLNYASQLYQKLVSEMLKSDATLEPTQKQKQ